MSITRRTALSGATALTAASAIPSTVQAQDCRHGGEAIIEGDAIVIRVPLATLPMVVEGAWATGNLNPRMQITNLAEFSADLIRALNDEEEDGSAPLHRLFDAAINEAINQGAFGIEEHKDQEA